MIYLIRSSSFKDKDDRKCNEHEVILKIGYTKDNSKKSRFDVYITENPTCQVLYLIPGGTEQDEKNLHNHFKEYLRYGQEWFSEVPEILNFFETHTTKESLQELKIKRSIRNTKSQKEFIKKSYIDPVLLWKCREEPETYIFTQIELENLVMSDLLKYNDQELDDYFKSTYPEVNFSRDSIINNPPQEILEYLDKFNNMDFQNKMKYIESIYNELGDCETYKLFLNNLPSEYINYITILGFDEIRTCGYQKSKIISRLSKKSTTKNNLENIKNEIISYFVIGNKYTKSFIKDKIRSIYESNGYNKSPKALDLEEYFELKSCQIQNRETGKRDMAFEIIKLKT